jgi:AcrR family transcriptional regulator
MLSLSYESMSTSSRKRTGRRPGKSRTREAILEAARRQFAELGYDRTTIRSIAAEAGVDAALVLHYFRSKQELFLAVVELPFDPAAELPALLAGDRRKVGERLARMFVGALEDADARNRWTSMIRAAASEPAAAEMLRQLLTKRVFVPLAETLGVEDAQLRATLVGSQFVGVVMARHIVRIEPLASLPSDDLAHAIAPTLQRYLTGPLGSNR